MKKYYILIILIFIFNFIIKADNLIPIPELKNRINDLTTTLTEIEKQNLETKLKFFEDSTGNQIVVLIVPTTGGESIEEYSMRVAESWKIGQAGKDNGVILLIAKDDRKLRIEVGYGLESTITDAYASIIIETYITPNFKNGYFYYGIDYGLTEIINLIQGNSYLTTKITYNDIEVIEVEKKKTIFDTNVGLAVTLIILCSILPMFLVFLYKTKFIIRLIASILVVLLNLYTGWALGDILMSLIFLPMTLVFALMTLIKVGNSGSGSGNYYNSNNSYNSYSNDSSYSSSSYNSSSNDSSYSGGGGNFGGGGASGSW